jgi:hypothetical protein
MRVILFQNRFISLIKEDVKTSTIRNTARCKPGDFLSLRFWSDKPYRSKQVEIRQVICTAVRSIHMQAERDLTISLQIDGQAVASKDHKLVIARHEGFLDWWVMQEWFQTNKGLIVPGQQYRGEMIEWKPVQFA